MKKSLVRVKNSLYYFLDEKKVKGENPKMTGNCSGLSGDCSGLSGNIDDCKLTCEERKKGVNINDLIK